MRHSEFQGKPAPVKHESFRGIKSKAKGMPKKGHSFCCVLEWTVIQYKPTDFYDMQKSYIYYIIIVKKMFVFRYFP